MNSTGKKTGKDNSKLTKLMFLLVQAGIKGTEPKIQESETIDWDGLMDVSMNQGLLALVWDGICNLPSTQQPPRIQKINWSLSSNEIWERYYLQVKVLNEMIEICNKNDMRLLLLKGIGLASLYPKPCSRPSGDIDIYLFDDYQKGNELFGDGVNDFFKKHSAFDYKGVHIENHVTPLDTDTKYERNLSSFLKTRMGDVILSSEGYYTFDPITNIVYLLAHSIKHFSPHKGIPYRNIIDFALFIQRNQEKIDVTECYNTLKGLKMSEAFELFVRMGELIMDIDLSKYHAGYVKGKDLSQITKFLYEDALIVDVNPNQSVRNQFILLFDKYRNIKIIYNYFPQKHPFLLIETFRHNIAFLLKRLLKIPENVFFLKGLKNRKS